MQVVERTYATFACFARQSRRQSLELVAASSAVVAKNLLSMTTRNLQHAEDHILLLGRKTSLERVAAFLLEMDKRLTVAGVMALPMSRLDIADYLGITLETVSRALSGLRGAGVLDFVGNNPREIVLHDRVRLGTFDLPELARLQVRTWPRLIAGRPHAL